MMFSGWVRVPPVALAAGLALWVTGAIAQEETREGYTFIPGPDEPCGVSCPDPGAPLSRANYPPGDDNFKYMFAASESGVKIVRNPHWNGREAPTLEGWCGIRCRDPYRPAGVANQFRRNDAYPYMLRFVRRGDGTVFGGMRNPHWVWREHDEAMELSTLYPPLPLSGLGASGTGTGPGAGESGSRIVSGSVDRTCCLADYLTMGFPDYFARQACRFPGLSGRFHEAQAECRTAVVASSRYAAPALRFGPSGDPPPSARLIVSMAVSGAFGHGPIARRIVVAGA